MIKCFVAEDIAVKISKDKYYIFRKYLRATYNRNSKENFFQEFWQFLEMTSNS